VAGQGAFLHAIGDRLQLMPWRPAFVVVGRAAGAFGAVYVIEDASGARSAIKTPRQDRATSQAALELFAREATIWSSLPPHPAILEAYGVFAHGDRPYVHMEYVAPINVHGSSLAALLRELREEAQRQDVPTGVGLSTQTVSSFAGNVVSALRHLEAEDPDFVHGDIKPENLLVRSSERVTGDRVLDRQMSAGSLNVLVADFGMARAAGATTLGRTGDVNYLAPELLEDALSRRRAATAYGEPEPAEMIDSTKSGDVYSIGCTIFELLFGFPRQVVDLDANVVLYAFGENPSADVLADARQDGGLPFWEFLCRCLDTDPSKRPAGYAALARELILAVEQSGGSLVEFEATSPPRADGYIEVRESAHARYLVDHLRMAQDEAERYLLTFRQASELRSLGRLDESDAVLEGLLLLTPGAASVNGSLGHNELLRQRPERARAYFEQAIAGYEGDQALADTDDAGYAATCCNLSQLLSRPVPVPEADPERAVILAERALALGDQASKIHHAHGMALLRAGRSAEAAVALTRAAELDPASPRIRMTRMCCAIVHVTAGGDGKAYPDQAATKFAVSAEERQQLIGVVEAYLSVLAREGKAP
jgi:serine/threonine protein kinase